LKQTLGRRAKIGSGREFQETFSVESGSNTFEAQADERKRCTPGRQVAAISLQVFPVTHTLGWHTFRHTYRSWLDDTGAPVGVQQKLMRHAQVSTTMNVYGNALMDAKREANSRVVRKALGAA